MTDKAALTIPEAAKYGNIGQNELRYQANNNPAFPAFKVGQRKILIDRVKFEKWIADMAQKRMGFSK
jgi:hypothetical protein